MQSSREKSDAVGWLLRHEAQQEVLPSLSKGQLVLSSIENRKTKIDYTFGCWASLFCPTYRARQEIGGLDE
jgi:hypothetical protein